MNGSPDRKLEALESVLTPRQRAILGVQKWVLDDAADERLQTLCPPQDRAEMDGIIRAVGRGNNELLGVTQWLFEWIAQTEADIHWLRVLDIYQTRETQIPHPIRRGLGKLPPVWDMRRQTHRAHGHSADADRPRSPSWEAYRAQLVADIRQSIQWRWQDYLRGMKALEEASDALGTSVMHRAVGEAFEHLRTDILRLVTLFEEAGQEVELPALDWDTEHYAKGAFKLEVLRAVPEKHARERMTVAARAELEAWEKEQAAQFDDE